jgi:hypothetical protein
MTKGATLPGTITVDSSKAFSVASGNGYKAVTNLGTFNAAGADKLVVVVSLENSNNDPAMIFGVRYNGVQMIEAVQQTGGNRDGALAIYYLDNPGAVGTGISVSGYNPNGGLGTAYALAVVVDDAAQGVTDVVRGADLFDATHGQRLLQALLGLTVPRYHHHPLVLGPDGKRLAKRDGGETLRSLRAAGTSAAAVIAGLDAAAAS